MRLKIINTYRFYYAPTAVGSRMQFILPQKLEAFIDNKILFLPLDNLLASDSFLFYQLRLAFLFNLIL
jgi:hypothetical protein